MNPLLPTVKRGEPRVICTADDWERKAGSAGRACLSNTSPALHNTHSAVFRELSGKTPPHPLSSRKQGTVFMPLADQLCSDR
jgi:hypothetical protein